MEQISIFLAFSHHLSVLLLQTVSDHSARHICLSGKFNLNTQEKKKPSWQDRGSFSLFSFSTQDRLTCFMIIFFRNGKMGKYYVVFESPCESEQERKWREKALLLFFCDNENKCGNNNTTESSQHCLKTENHDT